MSEPVRRYISRQRMQSLIAMTLSWSVHLVTCLVLAYLVVGTPGTGQSPTSFTLGSADDEPIELSDFAISNAAASSTDSPVPVNVPFATEQLSPVEVSDQVNIEIGTGPDQLASSVNLSTIAAITGGGIISDAESSDTSSGSGKRSGASFFGAEAHGDRFVFVIDSSGSMRGPRWIALCNELMRSLRTLSPEQEFYVISFDALAHPMFGTLPPKGKFLKASTENVKKLGRWLNSVQLGSNTFPATAMGIAMKLEPDAIFLLSDGEIRDSTLTDLRIWNRIQGDDGIEMVKVPIHTVLLHSSEGYATLDAIASENEGSFTPVPFFGGF